MSGTVSAPASPSSDAPWLADPIIQAAPSPGATPDAPWLADPIIKAGPTSDTGVAGGFAHRLGLGVRDVVEGVGAPLYDSAAWALRQAGLPVHTMSQNLDALGLPTADTPGEKMTSAVIQPVASTLTGQGVGRAMMGAAAPVVQGIGEALAAQPVTQAVAAGVGGATQEATGSPTAGLIAGLAVPLAGAAAGRVISPDILAGSPERAGFRATADQEGIPLSLAQQTGGKVARNIESTLANLPGSSGTQAATNATQTAAWNRANMARTGFAADTATPDVLNAARDKLGQTFTDLTARNTLTADPQFMTELQQAEDHVNRYVAPSLRDPLLNRIEDIRTEVNQNGTMPGRLYQNMYSELGGAVRSEGDGQARVVLGRLRDTLRDGMDRSISPADQAAWQDVRSKYANLQTIAKAMDRPSEGTAMGNISPAALAQASRNQTTKSFAFGQGNMDDLARLGQGALKQTVPDSGTAQRTVMANLLQGKSLYPALAAAGAMHNPAYLAAPVAELGLPWLAAKAYHSDWLTNYLTNSLASGFTPAPSKLLGATIAGENQVNRLRDSRQPVNKLTPP
jgi:hypothetical protein